MPTREDYLNAGHAYMKEEDYNSASAAPKQRSVAEQVILKTIGAESATEEEKDALLAEMAARATGANKK